ncbi:polysaccharide biosynthesis/export family protein, partial [Caminibacter sp.]
MKKIFLLLIFAISLFGVDIAMTQTPESNQTIMQPLKYKVFGQNLFMGRFRNIKSIIYNPNYRINIGDTIDIVFWGAYNSELKVIVDAQGNIFIPKVGVIHVLGVKAGELNKIIQNAVAKVFKNNVFVYANVLNYQPINVFVAGSVNKPGLYQGLGSDSIIQYLDKAGGISLKDGSFRYIDIKRNNNVIKQVDLYNFLLNGKLSMFQFKNGDVIYVHPLKYYFFVTGAAKRDYRFEIKKPFIPMKEVKKLAIPNEDATLIIVYHWNKNGEMTTKKLNINN